MARARSADGVLRQLLDERPKLHFGQSQDWSLDAEVLELLVELVEPQWRVLETGCGYSTIVLSAAADAVITVAPSPYELDTIRGWCAAHDIPLDGWRTEEAGSEAALPALEPGPLDLVLIDGAHAFPLPMLDWFYAGRWLRPGGILVVDDIELGAPRLLCEFLDVDHARWRALTSRGRTRVYERVGDEPLLPPDDWSSQPWSHPRRPTPGGTTLQRLRNRVRLRTRLHRATSFLRQ